MSRNPIGWFEIYVDDMPRAKAFYEGVFQQSLTPLPSPAVDPSLHPSSQMFAFPSDMQVYGCGGALVHMPGCPPMTMVYFSCDDCATEQARVVDAGGVVIKEKFSIAPYGHIALVRDSEGNVVGLHSMA